MDSIFMISGNSKTSNLHRLLVNLSDKTNLKQCNEYVAFLNLSICYILKKLKSYETYKFKIKLLRSKTMKLLRSDKNG